MKKIDILSRQKDIENLKKLIEISYSETKNHSFALNADWGRGKTFVLEQLKESYENVEDVICFSYNAWQNDFYDEPLIAILVTIINELNELLSDKMFKKRLKTEIINGCLNVFKQLLGSISNYVLHVNVVDTVSKLRKQHNNLKEESKITSEIDSSKLLKETISLVQKNLRALDKKIVFIIDEIDRCLPNYASKVLERSHHIFEGIENCVVIYSIDKRQLECLISNYYGDDFNIDTYLDKFIDFTYNLSIGEFNEEYNLYFREYLDNFENVDELDFERFREHINICFKGLNIRQRIKILNKLNILHKLAINRKTDLSIAYFEVLYMSVFVMRKEEASNILNNYFDDNVPFSSYASVSNNIIKKIFKDINFVKGAQYISDNIIIQNLKDYHALLFYYLRSISRYKINFSVFSKNRDADELQVSKNDEYIKQLYENFNLIN